MPISQMSFELSSSDKYTYVTQFESCELMLVQATLSVLFYKEKSRSQWLSIIFY